MAANTGYGRSWGSGDARKADKLSQFAATTSAELANVITDETGTGAAVLATSPALITPALGTPTELVGTNITGTGANFTAGTVSDDAITLAKMAPGIDGNIISYDASGNPVAIATGTDGQVLTSTGAGSPPAFENPSSGDALVANPLSQFAATTSAELAGVISNETGSGALVFGTSPTLVTPALGTPTALVGTSITGTGAGFTAGNVTTNANLTGDVTSVGNSATIAAGVVGVTMLADDTAGELITWDAAGAATTVAVGTATHVLTSNGAGAAPTFQAATDGDALVANSLSQFAATTSAELAGVISNETGSGLLVFGTSPTLVTPALGTPASGVMTNVTGIPVGALADGIDGQLITWDAAGAPAVVTVGTATQVLTSNGAGAAPTFQAAGGGNDVGFAFAMSLIF
jgi:hypothetical protein